MELLRILIAAPNWAEQIQAFASIVGLFGIVALLVTLKMQGTTLVLQQKQLLEQQQLTKIEQKRFLLEIRPEINVQFFETDKTIRFEIMEHDLISAIFILDNKHPSVPEPADFFAIPIGRLTRRASFVIAIEWDMTVPPETELMRIVIKYKDAIGTGYLLAIHILTSVKPVLMGPIADDEP